MGLGSGIRDPRSGSATLPTFLNFSYLKVYERLRARTGVYPKGHGGLVRMQENE
jgi:hypothetical protein